MATSKINSNNLILKTFTSEQFSIAPASVGGANFDVESFNIDGYRILTWRFRTASTAGLRNNINYFQLNVNSVKAYNFGSNTESGTVSIYVLYAPTDYLIIDE